MDKLTKQFNKIHAAGFKPRWNQKGKKSDDGFWSKGGLR
jgi:hypothetical protein